MKRDAIENIQASMSRLSDAEITSMVRDMEDSNLGRHQRGTLLTACTGLLALREAQRAEKRAAAAVLLASGLVRLDVFVTTGGVAPNSITVKLTHLQTGLVATRTGRKSQRSLAVAAALEILELVEDGR